MLIVMKPQATDEDIRGVCAKIEVMGFRAHPMPGAQRTAIGITGNPGPLEPEEFETLPGVAEHSCSVGRAGGRRAYAVHTGEASFQGEAHSSPASPSLAGRLTRNPPFRYAPLSGPSLDSRRS